ncbi:hypothetical protein C0993_012114 [Termitomyces sp. T159_Od127]|nr:hypothetical protein C0993_012114 [Termitomyces sp. T159_Od127]
MSEIYASLEISPRKKRCPPADADATTFTPKKLRRLAPPTPPPTTRRAKRAVAELPDHLTRLERIHTALQHALSHALATCAVSPTSDTGIVRNVLNHLSLSTYAGFPAQFDVDDLRRLCWVWEWDGKSLPAPAVRPSPAEDSEENPFLITPSSPGASAYTEWTRGGMGLVLSPTTHHSKRDRKRVPAYGLHASASPVPAIPLADLPELAMPAKISALTRTLASASPKGALSSLSFPTAPGSPSRSPTKSPTKRALRDFAIPFPITSAANSPTKKNSVLFPVPALSKSPTKSTSVLFPQTPSRRDGADLFSPRTPAASEFDVFDPKTPTHQKGKNATTVPQTPTSSRRQALYERVRQKSLTASPTKTPSSDVKGGKLTRDQLLKMGQEEMRRRCLLGRLGGVAESVWMLFSTPVAGSSSTPTARKRRALPAADVVNAVVKSSPVPISTAEASESLSMLAKLCPFFIRELDVGGKEWLEMPAANPAAVLADVESTPSRKKPPPSPGPAVKGKHESAEELVSVVVLCGEPVRHGGGDDGVVRGGHDEDGARALDRGRAEVAPPGVVDRGHVGEPAPARCDAAVRVAPECVRVVRLGGRGGVGVRFGFGFGFAVAVVWEDARAEKRRGGGVGRKVRGEGEACDAHREKAEAGCVARGGAGEDVRGPGEGAGVGGVAVRRGAGREEDEGGELAREGEGGVRGAVEHLGGRGAEGVGAEVEAQRVVGVWVEVRDERGDGRGERRGVGGPVCGDWGGAAPAWQGRRDVVDVSRLQGGGQVRGVADGERAVQEQDELGARRVAVVGVREHPPVGQRERLVFDVDHALGADLRTSTSNSRQLIMYFPPMHCISRQLNMYSANALVFPANALVFPANALYFPPTVFPAN